MAKFRNRSHLFIEIYKTNIYISPLDEMDEYCRLVTKRTDLVLVDDPNVGGRCCYVDDPEHGRLIFIGINEYKLGVIVHEAFHATEYLFQDIGLPHCDGCSEAWAYMVQYIAEHIKFTFDKNMTLHRFAIDDGIHFETSIQKRIPSLWRREESIDKEELAALMYHDLLKLI